MNFLFAWRYFKSKKTTNAINIIAWISVVAIMVGTASLIIVLSVVNGFEDVVKSLYGNFYADLKVVPAKGKTIFLTPAQLSEIAGIKGIKSNTCIAEEKCLLQNGQWQTPAYLKGVDSNYTKVTGVASQVIKGKFETGNSENPFGVLGVGIENALAIQSDRSLSPITVYLPKRGATVNTSDPLQSLNADNVNTSGAFMIQPDFDNKYVITNLGFMQRMLGLQPNEYSALEVALQDPSSDKELKKQLQQVLGSNYLVQTRYEQNRTLYAAMQIEKWVIYGVLSLILIVAAFTMIGALTMLVLEKQKDIQILKSLGLPNKKVQNIFLSEGLLLAAVGGISGALLAIAICWAQIRFKLIPLTGGSFVIDYYPVKVIPGDVIIILATVLVIALIASWFPSRKAALQEIELR